MSRDNVVLITIDSLRADFVGERTEEDLTPFLDDLAENGTTCTRAYANGPRTNASFQSILTSRYPLEFGKSRRVSDDHVPVAKVFQDAGYHTACFHSNPYLSSNYGYDEGFDVFQDSEDAISTVEKISQTIKSKLTYNTKLYDFLRSIKKQVQSASGDDGFASASFVNEKVREWIDTQSESPFFLWVHYMDVHVPYNPPAEYNDGIGTRQRAQLNNKILNEPAEVTDDEVEAVKSLYKGEIRGTDDQIRELYTMLDQAGLLDNTNVIVTSDHGEEFGEYGHFSHAGGPAERASKLRDELLHVPFIIVPNGDKELDDSYDELMSLIDLGPTMTDLAKIDAPESWKGRSILHDEPSDQVFSEYWMTNREQESRAVSVRTRDGRMIYDEAIDSYDVALASNGVGELRQLIDEHIEMVDDTEDVASDAELSKAQEERLEHLGYLVE
jgi:arylsulfatase A-like enzyme